MTLNEENEGKNKMTKEKGYTYENAKFYYMCSWISVMFSLFQPSVHQRLWRWKIETRREKM